MPGLQVMGADRWAACPKCFKLAQAEFEAYEAEVRDAYGKVDVDTFEFMREKLKSMDEAIDLRQSHTSQFTFRENWDIEGVSEGTVTVDYRGSCSMCGLHVELKAKKEIDLE